MLTYRLRGEREITMENRETILKKIEKLLALAGNNPNEHEAIAAALKAQELMARYNIELAEVNGENPTQKIIETRYSTDAHCMSKWRYGLANVIAKNFCCKTYVINRDQVVFYGYEKDAKIALEVFKFLFETGNKLSVRYYNKCKKEGKSTKGVMNTYLMGFCDGIKEVLDKQCTALMIVTPKEVEESYAEFSKGFGTMRNTLSMSGDHRAYASGKEDGKTAASARALED